MPNKNLKLKKINRISSPDGKGEGLEIFFDSGESYSLSSQTIRSNCPCASCLEKRGDTTHQAPLTPKGKSLLKVVKSTADEELDLEKVWLLGNYALGMRWKDGHDSGIYTFDFLSSLVLS